MFEIELLWPVMRKKIKIGAERNDGLHVSFYMKVFGSIFLFYFYDCSYQQCCVTQVAYDFRFPVLVACKKVCIYHCTKNEVFLYGFLQ